MANHSTLLPHWLEDPEDPIYKFATKRAWETTGGGPPPTNRLARIVRVIDLAIRGLVHNDASTHSAAMTYTTILSLVPLLAFIFTMAKTFGAYDKIVNEQLNPMLNTYMPADPTPDAVGGAESTQGGTATPPATPVASGAGQMRSAIDQILGFVEKTDASKLGLFGLLAFLYTAIGLLKTLEHSFNRIFRVSSDRSMGRRVVDYTALLVLSPVLLALSVGVLGALQSNSLVAWLDSNLHLGPVFTILFKLVGAAILAGSFAFMYVFIPNTKVRLASGMVGGIVGFLLWVGLIMLIVKAGVGVAGYNSLYAGFAAFPILLFGLFLSWTATMLGAHVTWAHQVEPRFCEILAHGRADPKNREENAVRLLCILSRVHTLGQKPHTAETLARELALSKASVESLLDDLDDRGIVVRGEKEKKVVLAASANRVELHAVVAAVRHGDPEETPNMDVIDRALVALRKEEAKVPAGQVKVADLLGS